MVSDEPPEHVPTAIVGRHTGSLVQCAVCLKHVRSGLVIPVPGDQDSAVVCDDCCTHHVSAAVAEVRFFQRISR